MTPTRRCLLAETVATCRACWVGQCGSTGHSPYSIRSLNPSLSVPLYQPSHPSPHFCPYFSLFLTPSFLLSAPSYLPLPATFIYRSQLSAHSMPPQKHKNISLHTLMHVHKSWNTIAADTGYSKHQPYLIAHLLLFNHYCCWITAATFLSNAPISTFYLFY